MVRKKRILAVYSTLYSLKRKENQICFKLKLSIDIKSSLLTPFRMRLIQIVIQKCAISAL